jgi:hypothetical protein
MIVLIVRESPKDKAKGHILTASKRVNLFTKQDTVDGGRLPVRWGVKRRGFTMGPSFASGAWCGA